MRQFGNVNSKLDLSSRTALVDGGVLNAQSGSQGAVTQYNSGAAKLSSLLPPDPHMLSGRALLKRGYLAQALIDSTAVLFCYLFLIMIVLSVPLAILLLLVAEF